MPPSARRSWSARTWANSTWWYASGTTSASTSPAPSPTRRSSGRCAQRPTTRSPAASRAFPRCAWATASSTATTGSKSSPLVEALHEHRLAHAAGDAHRLDPVGLVERLEVVEQRGHDPRARHAERVAEGDRAPERVQLVVVDPQLVLARDDLGGERLVDLHDVDVVHRHPGLLQESLDRRDRAEAHDLRADRGDARRDDPRARLQPERLGLLLAHDEHRGGAVVQGAGVARRDRAVLAEGRLEPAELLHRRARARPV